MDGWMDTFGVFLAARAHNYVEFHKLLQCMHIV